MNTNPTNGERTSTVDRIRVQSSNIASVGYDPPRYLLEIEFLNGSIYQYARIPSHIYEAFMDAPSKGSFFLRFIRDQYPTTKISDSTTTPSPDPTPARTEPPPATWP